MKRNLSEFIGFLICKDKCYANLSRFDAFIRVEDVFIFLHMQSTKELILFKQKRTV